jgi:heptosyltransferase-2
LKGEAYDFVIDLHNNLRTAQIKSVLSVPAFSFPKINLEKWLKVQFGVDLLPAQHVVDRYFEAVAPLGVFNDGKGLDFFIATRDGALAIEGFNPETAFITWCIGGQHFTKRFPEKQVAALCRNLSVQVLLIGGPEDAVRAQQIVTAAGKHVFNACGLLNIHQSAYAISKSKLLLSNDTGMMHIGAALRKPIISFWGNTIPEFGMSPYYGGHPVQQRVLEIKDL